MLGGLSSLAARTDRVKRRIVVFLGDRPQRPVSPNRPIRTLSFVDARPGPGQRGDEMRRTVADLGRLALFGAVAIVAGPSLVAQEPVPPEEAIVSLQPCCHGLLEPTTT